MTDTLNMPSTNHYLASANPVSSKAIAQAARANPAILNLSIGEPDFGPPPHLVEAIGRQAAALPALLAGLKRYEHSRGDPVLRQAIAQWYWRRHRMRIDPEQEIIITHGGMEALNLALLAVTDPGDRVAMSNPGYTMYARALALQGRAMAAMPRPAGGDEYAAALAGANLDGVKALLLNSPENPTGYVLSTEDWAALARAAERADLWVIHDEVYDTMAYTRPHLPARAAAGLGQRSLLINSCSKKFGVPGLRIGWLIGPKEVIDAAARVHECLCLGVSIHAEGIANLLLRDGAMDAWFDAMRADLAQRNAGAVARLHEGLGYQWSRAPQGGMFLFPDVRQLHARLPPAYRRDGAPAGSAVAAYLLAEQQIATVPGSAYGDAASHIRLTNCCPAPVFEAAVARLAAF